MTPSTPDIKGEEPSRELPSAIVPDAQKIPGKWAQFFRGAVLGALINSGGCTTEADDSNAPVLMVNDQDTNEQVEIIKPLTEVKIDEKIVKVKEMPRRKKTLRERERVMVYPLSDEAKENIKTMKNDEKLTIFHEGMTDEGYPFQVRETVADAYKLAEAYAAGLGYCLEPISSYRTKAHQAKLYKNAPASHKGGLVAKGELSNHRNGSSVDVILCKIVDGKKVMLTPVRGQNLSDFKGKDIRRLEMLMNLAGFVRYKKEEWHFEIGSQDFYEIMKKDKVFLDSEKKIQVYQNIID